MKKHYTDYDLGWQHGRLCFESPKYPNNKNYMSGFSAGMNFYVRELELNRPFDDMLPGGCNDGNEDYSHLGI